MSDEPIACVVDLHLRAVLLLAKPGIVIELTGIFPLPFVCELFRNLFGNTRVDPHTSGSCPNEHLIIRIYVTVGIHISSAAVACDYFPWFIDEIIDQHVPTYG